MSTRGASPPFTAVISDLHLSDVEAADPRRPPWRRHKHADVSGDGRILALLAHLRVLARGRPTELVLNGDIFDFDTVAAIPDPAPFPVSWLERARGLSPEAPKSLWKIRLILAHHPRVVDALRAWVADGNTLVFVIGNHDLELHWPQVQAELAATLGGADAVTVCAWFRVAGGDTLVTHGNQLDPYCVCHDPLHPFIEVNGGLRVRSAFGNVAGKFMLNGMGLLNPHVESSFIRPFREYLVFFFRYVMRYQPLILWAWLWSALATLWVSVGEGLRPAHREPARLDDRIREVARRANASPAVVLALRDVAVHPAVFSPWRVARELWLDRALLLLVLGTAAFQVVSTLRWFSHIGPGWVPVALALLLPVYIVYARSCRSEVGSTEANIAMRVGELARIAGVSRVVMGHTHRASARSIDGVLCLNTGHWSPAFDDVECTLPVGINGFAWIHPGVGGGRDAELRAFDGVGSAPIPVRTETPEPEIADVLLASEA